MSETMLYKNTSDNIHRQRYLTLENNFSVGMKYTNAPLDSGYVKSIVNFNLKNDGECLSPRGGWNKYSDSICSIDKSDDYSTYCVHHATTMFIETYDGSDALLCNYSLLGGIVDTGFDYANAKLIVEYDGSYLIATYDDTLTDAVSGTLLMTTPITHMHGFDISNPVSRTGIYTSLEGNTYVLVKTDSKNILGVLYAKFSQDYETITWCVKQVEPTDVQPSKAINYGYNMFKDNPYTFNNTASANGAIQLTGVVPYAEDGKLLLTARPGTPITFKLYYKYNPDDLSNNDKYRVQWEMQDLTSNSDAEVLQKVRNSAKYTPGSEISFTCTPSVTSFSLIVRLYKQSEMDAQDAEWEESTAIQALVTKDEYLTPNQVTTLASYYLTSNSSSTLNVDAVAYSLGTATGMCTWQQRIVMWGVQNAKNTLFVSEINDPGYMPYPNNCEIYNDNIICAVPYLSNLLVFTETSLYKLTFADDGLSYTSTCVQSRLNMTEADANTVITVQNMVYFKSGNYFYMVVPNNYSTTTSVQLAPVTRSVEQMFDNFNSTLLGLLKEVYNLSNDNYNSVVTLDLLDYNVHIADTQVRNMYKFKVTYALRGNDTEYYYLDISLNYDTVLRAWTTYMWETTPYRSILYKPTVTTDSIFTHMYENNSKIYLELIQMDTMNPQDDFELDNDTVRTKKNYQYINTGYRTFSQDLKKRFREVQFCINSLEDHQLKFHTGFVVDDVEKVKMYKSETAYCTDPNDTNYGSLFIERTLVDPETFPELSELDIWELDTGMFPDITVYKVRYKMSSKGYGGSVQLLSLNEEPYELLHINWVYRVMFAR